MTFNIATFVAEIQDGFQKPNRFRVIFPVPQKMAGFRPFTVSIPNMKFFAESADLADIGFATRNIIRYGYGMSEKKPFAPLVNDISMTFYNDSLSSQLGFFQQWAAIVQRFDMSGGIVLGGGTGLNTTIQPYEILYKDDYVVDAMVTLIDNNDQDVITYRMRRMWPIHIANTKLGWAIVNDIMKVTVVFNFMDWYPDLTLGGTLVEYYKGLNNQGQQSTQDNPADTYLENLWNNDINSGPPEPTTV